VKVFGQHVPGSPFEVQTAMDPPFDYGFSHLGEDAVASEEGSRHIAKRGVNARSFVSAQQEARETPARLAHHIGPRCGPGNIGELGKGSLFRCP
jgi:hypothetical protein